MTGNYFSTLGVKAFGGRLLSDADDTPASTPAAVLSHQTWQTAYGSDPTVVGAIFAIDGHPFTIVGVTPRRRPGSPRAPIPLKPCAAPRAASAIWSIKISATGLADASRCR